MINIEVHSIDSISSRVKEIENANKKYAIISIVSPGKIHPLFFSSIKNCMGILYLRFYDVENIILQGKVKPISAHQTKKIVLFFNSLVNPEKIKYLLVHCEAGISRSAGVAAALSKIYTNDDHFFFKKYIPNQFVYHSILNTYHHLISKKGKDK